MKIRKYQDKWKISETKMLMCKTQSSDKGDELEFHKHLLQITPLICCWGESFAAEFGRLVNGFSHYFLQKVLS